jgi:hypothetical protein
MGYPLKRQGGDTAAIELWQDPNSNSQLNSTQHGVIPILAIRNEFERSQWGKSSSPLRRGKR